MRLDDDTNFRVIGRILKHDINRACKLIEGSPIRHFWKAYKDGNRIFRKIQGLDHNILDDSSMVVKVDHSTPMIVVYHGTYINTGEYFFLIVTPGGLSEIPCANVEMIE